MKLTFCGAAQEVTGSCHLITLDSGYKILLDCGLYQGRSKSMEGFNESFYFNPADIDVVLMSHAHIDHSGRLPKLVKDGFKGDIIATNATRDLCSILLLDSGYIQEKEAEWENRDRSKEGLPLVDPLYTVEDVPGTMEKFVGIAYNRWFPAGPSVRMKFRDAGHILGSASIEVEITENGKKTTVGFTGDIGRPERPILRDPIPLPRCDHYITESTYAGKEHQDGPSDEEGLLDVIQRTCIDRKGKLVIPAFSVGRTQEIVYMLDRLETAGKLPKIPIYVDSPLSVNATDIFQLHPECYDSSLLKYLHADPNPFGFNELRYIKDVNASKAINASDEPCVIISSSGMMTAGRVLHHIANTIENPRNTIMIVGYVPHGTLGSKLKQGHDTVKIHRKELAVKAEVKEMHSFSAHGDHEEMLDFAVNQDAKTKVYLVHGEKKRQPILKEGFEAKGLTEVMIPALGESVDI